MVHLHNFILLALASKSISAIQNHTARVVPNTNCTEIHDDQEHGPEEINEMPAKNLNMTGKIHNVSNKERVLYMKHKNLTDISDFVKKYSSMENVVLRPLPIKDNINYKNMPQKSTIDSKEKISHLETESDIAQPKNPNLVQANLKDQPEYTENELEKESYENPAEQTKSPMSQHHSHKELETKPKENKSPRKRHNASLNHEQPRNVNKKQPMKKSPMKKDVFQNKIPHNKPMGDYEEESLEEYNSPMQSIHYEHYPDGNMRLEPDHGIRNVKSEHGHAYMYVRPGYDNRNVNMRPDYLYRSLYMGPKYPHRSMSLFPGLKYKLEMLENERDYIITQLKYNRYRSPVKHYSYQSPQFSTYPDPKFYSYDY